MYLSYLFFWYPFTHIHPEIVTEIGFFQNSVASEQTNFFKPWKSYTKQIVKNDDI